MDPPPPPKTKVTIVGKNEICHWEDLVGTFLSYAIFGPHTSRSQTPTLSSNTSLVPGPYATRKYCQS